MSTKVPSYIQCMMIGNLALDFLKVAVVSEKPYKLSVNLLLVAQGMLATCLSMDFFNDLTDKFEKYRLDMVSSFFQLGATIVIICLFVIRTSTIHGRTGASRWITYGIGCFIIFLLILVRILNSLWDTAVLYGQTPPISALVRQTFRAILYVMGCISVLYFEYFTVQKIFKVVLRGKENSVTRREGMYGTILSAIICLNFLVTAAFQLVAAFVPSFTLARSFFAFGWAMVLKRMCDFRSEFQTIANVSKNESSKSNAFKSDTGTASSTATST